MVELYRSGGMDFKSLAGATLRRSYRVIGTAEENGKPIDELDDRTGRWAALFLRAGAIEEHGSPPRPLKAWPKRNRDYRWQGLVFVKSLKVGRERGDPSPRPGQP